MLSHFSWNDHLNKNDIARTTIFNIERNASIQTQQTDRMAKLCCSVDLLQKGACHHELAVHSFFSLLLVRVGLGMSLHLSLHVGLVVDIGAHQVVPERPVQAIVARVVRMMVGVRVHPATERHQLQRAERELVTGKKATTTKKQHKKVNGKIYV